MRLFAVDCEAEVEKIARAAEAAGIDKRDVKAFCRILCDCAGAEWPLSRKFGCAPDMAIEVLEHAYRLGLEAYGVSFHVGSQQKQHRRLGRGARRRPRAVFRECAERGIQLSMVNLGGGFPTKYLKTDSGGRSPMATRSSGGSPSTSATASRRRSSSPAAAWSATPA